MDGRSDLKGSFEGKQGEIGLESRGVKTLINAGDGTWLSLVEVGIRLARLHLPGSKADLCYGIWSR